MPRQFTLAVLIGLVVIFAITFFFLLQPFLLPLFLGAVLTIVVQPLFLYFVKRFHNRSGTAAAATTLLILALVLVPTAVGTFLGAVQLYDWSDKYLQNLHVDKPLAPQFQQQIAKAKEYVHKALAPEKTPQEFEESVDKIEQNVRKSVQSYLRTLAGNTPGMLGSAVSFLIDAVIVILTMYFFLADGRRLIASTERLIPLQVEYQERVRNRFVTVTRAVVLGTMLAALVQGLVTGAALGVAGFRQWILLTVLSVISAVIPFVGTCLVWIPCVIYLAVTDLQGNLTTIIVLSLFQLIVVGLLDNVVRAYVLNSDVKLHPLLALLSVMGGLQWFGLWGIFIGPIVASVLHALVEILHEELNALATAGAPPPTTTPAG
ncbi:MAG: AI-2E family transporter [Planctomycetales bacterium]